MKVALCLSGQPREFKRSYPHLKEKILDTVDTDIFIYCWQAEQQPFFEIEGSIRYPDEGNIQELLDLYNPAAATIENWNDDREKSFYDVKYEQNKGPHASIVRYRAMLYSIFCCNLIKNKYELDFNLKYDVVIKGRTDIKLNKPVSMDELETARDNRVLYSDVLRGDGMVSDILFFANTEVMDVAANLHNVFDTYHNKGIQFNTEIMFPYHLTVNKIEARQHCMGADVLRPPQAKFP